MTDLADAIYRRMLTYCDDRLPYGMWWRWPSDLKASNRIRLLMWNHCVRHGIRVQSVSYDPAAERVDIRAKPAPIERVECVLSFISDCPDADLTVQADDV